MEKENINASMHLECGSLLKTTEKDRINEIASLLNHMASSLGIYAASKMMDDGRTVFNKATPL